MKRTRTRKVWLAAAVACGLLAGCVERRFVIDTAPVGAIAYDEKGLPIGKTPCDRQFTYYGKYKITLVCDGCERLVMEEDIKPPWYEIPPFDFIAENLIPWTIRDVRRFDRERAFQLQPAQVVPPEAVLGPAQQLRDKARAGPMSSGGAPIEETTPLPDVP